MTNDIQTLAAKYIAGQASDEEIAQVRQWIGSSKENEEYYVQLYEAWHDVLHAEPGIIDFEHAYQLFLEKTTVTTKKSLVRRMFSWPAVAAAAALIIVTGGILYLYNQPDIPKETAWHDENVSEGGIRKLVLADGSTVWINAGSKFRYNADFGKESRTVYLDGEAFFDIAKSANKVPFLVKTKHFTIRDIGTVFNIKAYSEDPSIVATVIEGKISVEGKLSTHDEESSKVFLEKKQVLQINSLPQANKERIKVVSIDSSQIELYNGWKDNSLVFDEISFHELAKIIERRYDVEITIEDKKLEAYKYTGNFRNIEDITKVMSIIKATTPVNYTINGREVSIRAASGKEL
jgi:ferric-dicitrate binding protein FerR (iron transport regulator)